MLVSPTNVSDVMVPVAVKIPTVVIPDNTEPLGLTSIFVDPPYCNCKFPVPLDS